MKLINIKGNTYYIKGGTNTGVYIFNDNSVLLIDPGLGELRPKKILSLLEENSINIKYIINTHEHEDHYEGCSILKKINNYIKILSSKEAKVFIEHPELFADCIMGGKGNNLLRPKICKSKNNLIKVDEVIECNEIVLNKEKFEIIELSGHSKGSIGVLTKDKVLFVGDLFVGSYIINKFNLLLLCNVKDYLDSIEKVKNIDFEYLVLGHSKEIINRDEAYSVIENHANTINKYISQVKNQMKNKITIDKILKNIINNNNLSCNYKEYYYYRSSIVSIISYLVDLKEVDYEIKEGEVLYYSKNG